MGCDIHMFIEYKLGDGPWQADKNHTTIKEDDYEYLQQVSATNRHYALFAALAGVRGDGPSAKGLPEDVCELIKSSTKEDYGDDHSHSWSSLEEFKAALVKCEFNLKQDAEPIAFYDWRDPNFSRQRPSYINLLRYLENNLTKFKLELEAEQMLLGQPINTDVECRLVYWFDN